MAAPGKTVNKGACCAFVASLVVSAVLFWLLLIRTSNPICSIEKFDVFALKGKTNNNATHVNNTIHYDLKLKNRNFNKGIFYDDLKLSFYYKYNSHSDKLLIGNSNFSHFYQGRHKGTHRVENIQPKRIKWENVTTSGFFRVELMTEVRFKNTFWKTKRHDLVVGADLKVNDQGTLVKRNDNKGVTLRSNAKKNSMGCFKLVGILGILIFIHYSW